MTKSERSATTGLDLSTPKFAGLRLTTLDYEERICFAVTLPPPPSFAARSLASRYRRKERGISAGSTLAASSRVEFESLTIDNVDL